MISGMGSGRLSRWISGLILGSLFCVTSFAGESEYPVAISVPEVGCALSLPAGFEYAGFHDFYYEAKGPEVRVRLHPSNPQAKTPTEAMQMSAARRARIKAETTVENNKRGIFVLLSSESFQTASGLYGVKAYYGVEGVSEEKAAAIYYYVGMPNGRVACVCLNPLSSKEYPHGSIEKLKAIEQAILKTFKVIPIR